MEHNVVSSETAEKLYEAGWQIRTHYFYYFDHRDKEWHLDTGLIPKTRPLWDPKHDEVEHIAAPTAQELADQLPRMFDIDGEYYEWQVGGDCDGYFTAGYERNGSWRYTTGGRDSLAEALAALWLSIQESRAEKNSPADGI